MCLISVFFFKTSKFLKINCFSFQTLFKLGAGLESVGDATNEANGNEDDKKSGKTAEDDASFRSSKSKT